MHIYFNNSDVKPMKFVIKIYILSMLSTSFLFSQLIEIDKIYSLSVEGIDLQRAYINSDNMMIAAEQLISPLQVYFFSIDDNFTKPQALSRRKLFPGQKNTYKAFQFRWSPLDPVRYYYCLINNNTNEREFWTGEFSISKKKSIVEQINNNSMYASEFYPAEFPSLKVIGIDNGFSEDDIWFLGIRDVHGDYFLYSSDERFTSRENRIFQNTDYIPLYFDVHYNPQRVTTKNDGYQYAICIKSDGDLDIIYYNDSNQLTKKHLDIECPCQPSEKMELETSIGSQVACSRSRHSYDWPENEKYLYLRNGNSYDEDVSDYVPVGEQFQPRFNHTGDQIAFINREPGPLEQNNFKLITFDIPDNLKYKKIEEKITNIQDHYQIVDDNLFTNDNMDLSHWAGTDFCWHPSKNILFYVKEVTVNNEVKQYLMYNNIDDNVVGHLDTGTMHNAMPTISNDGEFLLFHHLGKEDNGDYHFENCSNKGQKNTNCCYATANLKYKIGAARLKY